MKKIEFKNKKEKIIVYSIYYLINTVLFLVGSFAISFLFIFAYFIGLSH